MGPFAGCLVRTHLVVHLGDSSRMSLIQADHFPQKFLVDPFQRLTFLFHAFHFNQGPGLGILCSLVCRQNFLVALFGTFESIVELGADTGVFFAEFVGFFA